MARLRHFATSPFTAWTEVEGRRRPVPSGTAHAKAMGGRETVCGLNSATWPKFFELDFKTYGGETCPDCLEALRRGIG